MEANEFIIKLKSDTAGNDAENIDKVYESYKVILSNLATKDRSLFSLNVLCTLCRNLDKAPAWREHVDCRALLNLSIDCVRETRAMASGDRIKTLACIYHIHKHVIKQTKHVPPELILKISFMPFEADSKYLLKDYSKTYWNILVDRMCYIEKLKHIPISKVLPKLTKDLLKTIEIYDTVQFCSTVLLFLVKKLHYLFTNHSAKALNETYLDIFKKIASNDLKKFKSLSKDESLNIYVKLNECLYIVVENATKIHFQNFIFDKIVLNCITILEDSPVFFHCFQTFYLNCFHHILTSEAATDRRTCLKCLLLSLETTQKIEDETALNATYPFLNNFLRIYIEYNITNVSERPWKTYFDVKEQEVTLKILLNLMRKLKHCKQSLKCENCTVQTGIHDSLRTSFLLKNFINISLSQKLIITDLQAIIIDIINEQNRVLAELNKLGCSNHDKCYRKNQTDIHNSAISLHKARYYEFSIQLFDLYLKSEFKQSTIDTKNVSRALYNKGICQLDSTLYKNALVDAYLSLIFSKEDGLTTDKQMVLVMDIKSKELKTKTEGQDDFNEMQIFSILDAVRYAIENNLYGDMTQSLKDLPFEVLLRHEFKMYAKLWPSIAPIGGVWKALLELYTGVHNRWTSVNKTAILWTLLEIVLETASVVRTIHSNYFETTVLELLNIIQQIEATPEINIIHAALLFLNTEYTLAASGKKYGWKQNEQIQNSDPDLIPANRTLAQEHSAIVQAIEAVDMLTGIMKTLDKVSNTSFLRSSLPIYQVFVYQFLYLSKMVQALQLAYICCQIADHLDDTPTYIMNAGNLLYHMATPCNEIEEILMKCGQKWEKLSGNEHLETAIMFICDSAMYYSRRGSIGLAARLVQIAQAKLLAVYDSDQNINVEIAVGRLMEAQLLLYKQTDLQTDRQTILTEVNGIQRHYISVASTGPTWSGRRGRSLLARWLTSSATLGAARAARQLQLLRRAAAAAAVALAGAAAGARARLYAEYTDVHCADDAQIKIDNRLKYILGLPPPSTAGLRPPSASAPKGAGAVTPQAAVVEPMRDIFTKNQTSPSVPCLSVPAFTIPEFVLHNCGRDRGCYACVEPLAFVVACKTAGLEAALYFRSGEIDIARNYFDGAIKLIELSRNRLSRMQEGNFANYEKFLVKNVLDGYLKELKEIEIEILIEASFLELKSEQFDLVDEYIVNIHEIVKEYGVNEYLKHEVLNLTIASADLRKTIEKPNTIEALEEEFEKLELDSAKEAPKTPEIKVKIPKEQTKKIVKDEEVFKKRKVIKLNLDDDSNDFEAPKITKAKSAFKIPVPKLTQPSLELATPVLTRSIPKILITHPSEETPVNKKTNEFSTPNETPEQFFTPMTSVKTYTKKNLRQNIVKKLEDEFSTPKQTDKQTDELKKAKKEIKNENVLKIPRRIQKVVKTETENAKPEENTDSKYKQAKKETLRRATSPGKLPRPTNPTGKATTKPGEKLQNPAGRNLRRKPRLEFSCDDDKTDTK